MASNFQDDTEALGIPLELEKGDLSKEYLAQAAPCSTTFHVEHFGSPLRAIYKKLHNHGVETRGIQPVPVEDRLDPGCSTPFWIWFSANINVLGISTGSLAPLAFGLRARDSCLVILFVNLICGIPPAYIATWGPKLGLRQMVQARYSYGYYGAVLPGVLNAVTLTGFGILSVILGGQTLANARDDGNISWSVGIVIVGLLAFFLSFCGYKVISWIGRVICIPICITLVIALGLGGKSFVDPPTAAPASAVSVLSFASVIAGFTLSFSSLSMDFTCYIRPGIPSWRMFFVAFMGICAPIGVVLFIGAVFGATSLANPEWHEGYVNGNVGGLLTAVLRPLGGFGKFLVVLMSLSLVTNVAIIIYSISLSIQTFLPILLGVPRFVFSTLVTAIVIPLGIAGSHSFQVTLNNFLAIISYWVSAFVAIILIEHFVFRHGSFSSYNISYWDNPQKLPTGVSALVATVLSMGLAITCINQVWFVGPVAEKTGDIGFEVAFVACGLIYLPLRGIEKRWFLERSGLVGLS